ncbi:LapA family protein [Geobacillus sp. BMUD]|uniref:LapA family protein n=1 Tax=Geobacillus sp. BMUD TaxID=2508876 RepID=UPI00149261F4|nr:LapA family protein [Geobacillus sp. BMUD]NNU84358.1 LapA family protein [Geobacillus sp. BMUD]
MKGQINVILALVLALLVALLAVANVEQVTIHYLVGETRLPLIIVIFGSAVLGGLVVGMLGWVRLFSLRRQVKLLEREREEWAKTKVGNDDGEAVSLEREG